MQSFIPILTPSLSCASKKPVYPQSTMQSLHCLATQWISSKWSWGQYGVECSDHKVYPHCLVAVQSQFTVQPLYSTSRNNTNFLKCEAAVFIITRQISSFISLFSAKINPETKSYSCWWTSTCTASTSLCSLYLHHCMLVNEAALCSTQTQSVHMLLVELLCVFQD